MREPSEKKLPDAEGWWARLTGPRRGGQVDWFKVEMLTDDDSGLEGGPRETCPMIFVYDIQNFLSVETFTKPATRWFGPVALPWNDE